MKYVPFFIMNHDIITITMYTLARETGIRIHALYICFPTCEILLNVSKNCGGEVVRW